MLKNSEQKGDLKGKGKPFAQDFMQRDVFQNFQEKAKDAGFLPEWLKLQKEISVLIYAAQTEEDIDKINEKIKKYNLQCPIPMQRTRVFGLEGLDKAKNTWAF
ncbi:hypothetical protein AB990_03610 [Alkalihalobacillus pseudalcaliphilus]|nr:hypothetical protein AB990_03610 [Alkalihalobacillus pseudalcaliphilus]